MKLSLEDLRGHVQRTLQSAGAGEAMGSTFGQLREGITFIGPSPELLENMGDKTAARTLAHRYQVPTLPGTEEVAKAEKERQKAGK